MLLYSIKIKLSRRMAAAGTAARTSVAAGLKGVKNIIAVSSCKGGVGKSMVSVNLAFSLAKRLAVAGGDGGTESLSAADGAAAAAALPARVGLFDADLYGPSLPTMVALPPEEAALRPSENVDGLIRAPEYMGVRMMSYGYANTKGGDSQAAVMRGPRASAMVSNLVNQTDWGELDLLIVDMPPGTGDIPLTLCQSLQLTAAVVVTTPSRLAVVDVVKGIEMFDNLRVPLAALVENMSYFDASFYDIDGDGHRHGHGDGSLTRRFYPFGRGHVDKIVEARNMDAAAMLFSLPMDASVCEAADGGVPAVLLPETDSVRVPFDRLSDKIVKQFVEPPLHAGAPGVSSECNSAINPNIHFDKNRGIVLRYLTGPTAGTELVLDPATLRRASRDALSVDEMTGEQILQPRDVPDDIVPLSMRVQGNYGVAIDWSDGHNAGIYSYEMMEELAKAEAGIQ